METQFRQDIITTVPTYILIDNCQELRRAFRDRDWSVVEAAADSLSDIISDHTKVPESLDISPSGSSMIDTSCKMGIILDADGRDMKCVAGMSVSETIYGGSGCECSIDCQSMNGCSPECGRIRLGTGKFDIFDSENPAVSLTMLEKLGENVGYHQKQKGDIL